MMTCFRRQCQKTSHPARSSGGTAGFTLIEMLTVVVMISLLSLMLFPKVSRTIMHAKINEAASMVAGDLEQAVALAGRIRKPVTVAFVSGGKYTIRDRATSPNDSLRLSRDFAISNEQGARSVTFTPTSVTIYPNGLVSASLVVDLTSDGYTRQVTLSPAGLVRLQ